ncbi:Rqc2 family fibronectin-binding protein [Natranaerobius thermophilus]|uniref:Rqc2 homolog RqcH n=1 Tax=Natranaerobius thermophilus (strain ATCC BAA-1301 / DSM 18059 / JW/NM-WN-LF) TaxID=457570 RepID=B2A2J3_NATTJ|nr:NFACT RNA binding domain-containing protein [Natranaerobius thermophilus]ACB84908.1 Fibronectin-binding A domain protein [Natranaerobius thermophilus JW/NM-WN-LF]
MPIDGFTIRGIVGELQKIIGSKINQIHQPQKEVITLKLYGRSGQNTLLLSAHPKYCRVNLTEKKLENPASPSSFCMFLRKFLVGGKITDIVQYHGDRIVDIHIKRRDEFDLTEEFLLTCEIMGKHSNVILVNKKTKRIMDALRRIQRELSASDQRELVPGTLFERPPAPDKLDPFSENLDKDKFNKLLSQYQNQIDKLFFDNFLGVSPFLSKQIINTTYPEGVEANELYNIWEKIINDIMSLSYQPVIVYDKTTTEMKDVYWDNRFYNTDNFKLVEYDTLNQAIDDFAHYKGQEELAKQLKSQLKKKLSGAAKKARKKLKKQTKEYETSEGGTKYKKYGELLSANYHLVNNAHTETVEVYDYYQDPPKLLGIKIDPSKTPGENIDHYFKKFKKCTNRIKKLGTEIKKTRQEISYLEGLLFQVDEAAKLEELKDIRQELMEQGYLKKQTKDREKAPRGSEGDFIKYTSSDGFTIMVGKNNKQNDRLTLKKASKNDTWFHTKEIAGTHVIVKGDNIPEATILEAAQVAAYHSKARNSENVPVDYTQIKNVRKPKGAKPGMVIYDNHKTLYVDPKLPQTDSN